MRYLTTYLSPSRISARPLGLDYPARPKRWSSPCLRENDSSVSLPAAGAKSKSYSSLVSEQNAQAIRGVPAARRQNGRTRNQSCRKSPKLKRWCVSALACLRRRGRKSVKCSFKDPSTNFGLAGSRAGSNQLGPGGRFWMRRIATFLEIILSATLLVAGLYLLYEGTSSKLASAPAMLIGGAVCFTMSVMTLASAVKSLVWHRRMLRHSVHSHGLESAASEHNRS